MILGEEMSILLNLKWLAIAHEGHQRFLVSTVCQILLGVSYELSQASHISQGSAFSQISETIRKYIYMYKIKGF